MKKYENMIFDQERALYGEDGIEVTNCRFDGPADGESALKESRNIRIRDCYFNLRYPFWHDTNLEIEGSEMTGNCRASLLVYRACDDQKHENARDQGASRMR